VSFSLLGAAASLSIGLYAVPWGDNSFKDLAFTIAESQGDLGIKERVFTEPFENVVFYVNSFSSQDKAMRDIFVVDNRDKEISNNIIAEEGRILLDPERRIISLHFNQGTLFILAKDRTFARAVKFNTYDLSIGLKDILAALRARKKTPKEMSLNELKQQLKEQDKGSIEYNETLIELLNKFSIPLSVFFMGIIGVPLGARLKGRGRSAGIGLSLAVFLVYYGFLGAVRSICETGFITPKLGVWIPSFFLLVAIIYLLWTVGRDRSANPLKIFRFRAKQNH
jgi:lipopolysaccharide export system permease protein